MFGKPVSSYLSGSFQPSSVSYQNIGTVSLAPTSQQFSGGSGIYVTNYFDLSQIVIVLPPLPLIYNLEPTRFRKVYGHVRQWPVLGRNNP